MRRLSFSVLFFFKNVVTFRELKKKKSHRRFHVIFLSLGERVFAHLDRHLFGLLLQLLDDLVARAAVVAARRRAVLLPLLQADPAEVVLALLIIKKIKIILKTKQKKKIKCLQVCARDALFTSAHLGTLHVVAALVLLNGGLAVGTGLGVGQQPQAICGVLVSLAHTCHCQTELI